MTLDIIYFCNGVPFDDGSCEGTCCQMRGNNADPLCNHTLNKKYAESLTTNKDQDSVFVLSFSNDKIILYEQLRSDLKYDEPCLYIEKDVVFNYQK